MKTIALVIVGVFLIVALAYAGFHSMTGVISTNKTPQTKTSLLITEVGTVQKAEGGDDYTHHLVASDHTVKLNSYTVDFSQYEGKTAKVTGEYSGNTLFVDEITKN